MNHQAELDRDLLAPLEAVEARLASWIDRAGAGNELAQPLADAMRYATLHGGKRLRPLLVCHICDTLGGDPAHALDPAAAVELVHAFSLVHDDLPAMDDDDLRRGRPTLHVHAGEAMAILAGDAMLSLAFDALARSERPADVTLAMIRELTRGTAGMITGQVYDTLPRTLADADPADAVERTHRHKTGALIRAACRMGAIAAQAPSEQIDKAGRFGEAIGLMFQAVDDLIDVEQPAEHAGKQTRKDAEAGKRTYPVVHGIEATRALVARLETDAHALAHELAGREGRTNGALAQIVAYLARRDR